MPRRNPPKTALYVRLPASASDKLERATKALGITKKDLITHLVSTYAETAGTTPRPQRSLELVSTGSGVGSYSFRPYDPPEVLTVAQAAQMLQVAESVVLELAEDGSLPGRKLGDTWRFSRDALLEWLGGAGR